MRLAMVFLLPLSGCALAPNAVHVGAEHISSIAQHFETPPQNLGVELATVSAVWTPTRYTYLEVQDGYILNDVRFAGARDVFEARFGLSIPVKP